MKQFSYEHRQGPAHWRKLSRRLGQPWRPRPREEWSFRPLRPSVRRHWEMMIAKAERDLLGGEPKDYRG